jgi:hypothetical protein
MRNISCLVSPIPDHAFFEQSVFEGEIGDDLLQRLRFAAEIRHLVGGRGARSVAGKPPFTGLTTAELGYALLPPQPFQDDADFLFS